MSQYVFKIRLLLSNNTMNMNGLYWPRQSVWLSRGGCRRSWSIKDGVSFGSSKAVANRDRSETARLHYWLSVFSLMPPFVLLTIGNGLVECLLNRPCPQSYAPVWAACGSKLAWRQIWWNTKRLLFWFRYSRRLVWAFGIAWKMLQGKENDWWIWTCLWWWKNILTIGGCNGIKSSLWKEKGYSWRKLLWKLLTKIKNRRAVSKQWR